MKTPRRGGSLNSLDFTAGGDLLFFAPLKLTTLLINSVVVHSLSPSRLVRHTVCSVARPWHARGILIEAPKLGSLLINFLVLNSLNSYGLV